MITSERINLELSGYYERIYQDGKRVGEAALSNGEFVMKKAAVDGAGGAAQMYRIMHDLEKRGKA